MPYSELGFLLDHTNVTDVINRFFWTLDRHDWDANRKLFAEKVIADYSAIGREVLEHTADEQMEFSKSFSIVVDKVFHGNTTIIVDLPQPDDEASPPSEVSAHCNSILGAHKDSFANDPRGPVFNAGWWYGLKLVREASPPKGQNPWRISYVKANMNWSTGNPEVVAENR